MVRPVLVMKLVQQVQQLMRGSRAGRAIYGGWLVSGDRG